MSLTVDTLPGRPLTRAEIVEAHETAREYCVDPIEDVAYIFSYLGEEDVYALGLDDTAGEWVVVSHSDVEDSSEEAFEEFEEKIYTWAKNHYGDELEKGALKMAGPSDSSVYEEFEPDWDSVS